MRFAGIGSSGRSENYIAAGLIAPPGLPGPIERLLHAERAAAPKVETRTLRMSDGDTLMGMLQDAGVAAKDATAVVDAMKPLYSPRNIRSGQNFTAVFDSPGAVQQS